MLAGRTHLSVEVLEQLAGQVVAIGAAVVVGSVPEGTDPMATRRENEVSSFCKKVIFVFVLLPSAALYCFQARLAQLGYLQFRPQP